MKISKIRISIAVLVFFIGLVIAYFGYSKKYDVDPSANWPTINGQVKSSKISRTLEKTQSNAGVYNAGIMGTHVNNTRRNIYNFFVELDYSYTVDGEEYRGSQIYPHKDPSFTNESEANDLKTRFYKGKNVIVHYNESNPNESYLIYEKPSIIFYVICAILFVVVFPLLSLFANMNFNNTFVSGNRNTSIFGNNQNTSGLVGYQQPTMINLSV